MEARIKKIVDDVKYYCEINSIMVNIDPDKKRVLYSNPELGVSMECSGFFYDYKDRKELHVGTGKDLKEWLPILLHEFSHAVQCINQEKVWLENKLPDGKEHGDILDMYSNDRGVDKETAANSAQKVIQVELDCEKKVVELIKKYKIEDLIDIKEYIQKSNAYVLFYHVFLQEKKWYKDKAPYEIKELYSQLPDYFLEDYSQISKEHYEIIKKSID